MYKKLCQERLEARKSKNKDRTALITGVISDIDQKVLPERKAAEAKGESYLVRDETVIAVIKNLIKNLNKSIEEVSQIPGSDESVQTLKFQVDALEEFLPEAVTGDDLRLIIQGLNANSLGMAMGMLKKASIEQGFSYDGREASQLAKGIFI